MECREASIFKASAHPGPIVRISGRVVSEDAAKAFVTLNNGKVCLSDGESKIGDPFIGYASREWWIH